MIEQWRDVPGYEGYYMVSDYGRVKSMARTIVRKNNSKPIFIQEKILKQTITASGYCMVTLCKNGIKRYLVHRLVAEAFIPNPNNYPCVNHKSEIPSENYADNLEWCSVSYNNNYGNHNFNVAIGQQNRKDISKPILQIKNGMVIAKWPSAKEVQRQLGIHQSNISECISGKRKTAGGYSWQSD